MSGIEILNKFGFEANEEPLSIYPFSPVYQVQKGNRDFIIKRTQKRATNLIEYTKMLKRQEINVVTPVDLGMENPQQIGETNFVVYPFIEGSVYSGQESEIYEAGKFLGRIHSLSPNSNSYKLPEYDVYDFNNEEVQESASSIEKLASGVNVAINRDSLQSKLLDGVRMQTKLQHAGLPHVATPHDYKANNLIYTPTPYLIDPDNATWIPRIFDLALVLLLFHNEHKAAPKRVFTPGEWGMFFSGYKELIHLTAIEKENWKKALEHVFLDEVMWLMAEVEEDWNNPAQRELFSSLLNLLHDNSHYNLD